MAANILIVDDDDDDIDLAINAFQQLGLAAELDVARSGAQALEKLFGPAGEKTQPALPRIVLIDVKMPCVSGFDVLERLRAHPLGRDVIAIMLSCSSERSDIEHSRQLGADLYWRKPLRFEEFLDMIRRLQAMLFHGRYEPKR